MKILKQGNPDVSKGYKYFECSKCGLIAKASKDEYFEDQHYNQTTYYIICPCCKEKVWEATNGQRKTLMTFEKNNDNREKEFRNKCNNDYWQYR